MASDNKTLDLAITQIEKQYGRDFFEYSLELYDD